MLQSPFAPLLYNNMIHLNITHNLILTLLWNCNVIFIQIIWTTSCSGLDIACSSFNFIFLREMWHWFLGHHVIQPLSHQVWICTLKHSQWQILWLFTENTWHVCNGGLSYSCFDLLRKIQPKYTKKNNGLVIFIFIEYPFSSFWPTLQLFIQQSFILKDKK